MVGRSNFVIDIRHPNVSFLEDLAGSTERLRREVGERYGCKSTSLSASPHPAQWRIARCFKYRSDHAHGHDLRALP